ncbi:MAG TPA: hypothetical protein VFF98_03195 [Novosphingobium sp.]|nr:hypothetical protein [Novosphingobium sp.]
MIERTTQPFGGDEASDRPARAESDMAQMYQHSFAAGEGSPETRLDMGTVEQRQRGSRLAGLFSAAISLAMLVAVAMEIRQLHFREILAMIPRSAPFWLAFAAYYLVPPFTEWTIYRRLWGLPLSGVAALLRKQVSNELLLGYLGEVQFYAWARARLNMVAAPFGAIKDVTILSALTGNIATLVMLVGAWPLVMSGQLGMESRTVFMSLGVVLLTSCIILFFRQRLFSLHKRDLLIITGLHFGRIIIIVGLWALMWHLVLPEVELAMWLVLATLRMLISRLPLVPNKDVVFAGVAVFLLGHEAQISHLIAMMAGLLPVTHIVVGAIFASVDLFQSRKES